MDVQALEEKQFDHLPFPELYVISPVCRPLFSCMFIDRFYLDIDVDQASWPKFRDSSIRLAVGLTVIQNMSMMVEAEDKLIVSLGGIRVMMLSLSKLYW